MEKAGPLSGMTVIIGLSDQKEREQTEQIISGAGAASIVRAENGLEVVLAALREKRPVIICDTDLKVIDAASALRYTGARVKYSTTAVIADDWSEENMDDLLGSVDVFVERPVSEHNLVPGISVDAARKKRMMDLELEFSESEASFAKDKKVSFAEHVIMDTLGLSRESAGVYIKSLAEKNGYDGSDAAEIVYEALLGGDKGKL